MRKTLASLVVCGLLMSFNVARAGQAGGTFVFPDTVSIGDTVQISMNIQIPGGVPTELMEFSVSLVQGTDSTQLCSGSAQVNENYELIYTITCIIPDNIELGNHDVVIAISTPFGTFAIPGGGQMRILGDHDVDGSGGLNIADATALIDFIFNNGTPPLPGLSNGDLTCDGRVNIGDATKIIEYIFVGGSLPCYNGV